MIFYIYLRSFCGKVAQIGKLEHFIVQQELPPGTQYNRDFLWFWEMSVDKFWIFQTNTRANHHYALATWI
jgi:hypothetical protein